MRRKSNFAPSDSEEREDERCMGLHSNDMIEIVCFYMQGCTRMHACVCVCTGICFYVYYPIQSPRNIETAVSL